MWLFGQCMVCSQTFRVQQFKLSSAVLSVSVITCPALLCSAVLALLHSLFVLYRIPYLQVKMRMAFQLQTPCCLAEMRHLNTPSEPRTCPLPPHHLSLTPPSPAPFPPNLCVYASLDTSLMHCRAIWSAVFTSMTAADSMPCSHALCLLSSAVPLDTSPA